MAEFHYKRPDGGLAAYESIDGFPIPDDWTEISKEEYDSLLAEIDAANAAHLEAKRAARAAEQAKTESALASAKVKLAALGLSVDEVAAIVGKVI
jgi:hypothetical protein